MRPGDVLHVEGEVAELILSRTKPQETAKVKWTAYNQHGEAVYTFTPIAILARRFAVLAVGHGIGFVLVPDQVASAYGLAISASSRLTAQLFGGALLFWGVILWFARDFPSEAARGVLIGTIIADVPSLIVVVMGTLAGTMNAMGWVAVLIYLVSAVGSGYFLMAQSQRLSPL